MDKKINITNIGYCNFRNQKTKFGIKADDRRRHIYVIGKTGSGKSTLLENMTIDDIRSGKGVAVIDPHGEFAEKMLDFIPEERLDDVIYVNPADLEHPIAFNPIEQAEGAFAHLIVSGLMGIFKKMWPDAWSARMEYILNNTLLALIEHPGSTLLDVMRMFSDKEYRKGIVDNLKDPVVKGFWVNEFGKWDFKFQNEATAAIQNKVGQFISNPLIRNILGQAHSTLDMRKIMDEGKILIVNLSKGRIGEDNSSLLGGMIITRLQLAAMSRVDIPEPERRDFFLYVDEFQNFATESFANILSEARKYHLSLTIAHQYIAQIDSEKNTKVRDAVFGNVGTIITFRVGAADAEFLEKEFEPEFIANDLVNLPKANIYIKLMIDGVASAPFSAETIPPIPVPTDTYRDVAIKNSQTRYSVDRTFVEKHISDEWQNREKSEQKADQRDDRQPLSSMLKPRAMQDVHYPRPQHSAQSSSQSQPTPSGFTPSNNARPIMPPPVRRSAPPSSSPAPFHPSPKGVNLSSLREALQDLVPKKHLSHDAQPQKAENNSV